EADFEEDPAPHSQIFGVQQTEDVLYVIHLSRLSKLVQRIIEKSSNAGGQTTSSQVDSLESCEELLQGWESQLPKELQVSRTSESLWVSMLYIAHRSRTPEDPSTPSRKSSLQMAMGAADRIVRIVEDILSSSLILQCPIHIIPSLFAAMGMHAGRRCSNDRVLEQVGHVKIRLCMIALRELQSTWPVSGWIFLLFTKIIRRIRDDEPSHGEETRAHSRAQTVVAESGSGSGHEVTHDTEVNGNTENPPFNAAQASSGQAVDDSGPSAWNAQIMNVPLSLPTDWGGITEEDMWLDPDFDFMMGMPTTFRA
ncbi:hypothetical protein LTR16_006561, partial [Cryomyces antarcticus]